MPSEVKILEGPNQLKFEELWNNEGQKAIHEEALNRPWLLWRKTKATFKLLVNKKKARQYEDTRELRLSNLLKMVSEYDGQETKCYRRKDYRVILPWQ